MASAPDMAAAETTLAIDKYDSLAGAGPMHTDWSASWTGMESRSTVEWTATLAMPISRQARITRSAISPRLATRIFLNIKLRFGDG
jgi:hypothetical protein